MALKIDKFKNSSGFTLIELLLVSSLIVIIFTVVRVFINPPDTHKKARDEVRLSDIYLLSTAIEEYYLNTGGLPDEDNVTRTSNIVPSGNTGPNENSTGDGWIDANFQDYLTKIPSDPLNTGSNVYRFRKSGTVYELNVVFESTENTSKMSSDGGDDSGVYELGTSLTLIN